MIPVFPTFIEKVPILHIPITLYIQESTKADARTTFYGFFGCKNLQCKIYFYKAVDLFGLTLYVHTGCSADLFMGHTKQIRSEPLQYRWIVQINVNRSELGLKVTTRRFCDLKGRGINHCASGSLNIWCNQYLSCSNDYKPPKDTTSEV